LTVCVISALQLIGPFSNRSEMGDYSPNPASADVTTPWMSVKSLAKSVKFTEGCKDGPACKQYSSSAVEDAVTGNDINFVLVGTGW
jgi:hypothetical protein